MAGLDLRGGKMRKSKLEKIILVIILAASIGVVISSAAFMATHNPHRIFSRKDYVRIK